MRVPAALCFSLILILLPACQMNERMSGTVIGGVGGAAIGGAAGGVGGAAIGGLAGALTGYLVGDYLADQRERGRPNVFGSASDGTVAGIRDEPENVKAARRAYEQGRHARTAPEARRWFEESLRLNPDRPEPYNLLGLNALYAGDPAAADHFLQQALRVDPTYERARDNLRTLRQTHRQLR